MATLVFVGGTGPEGIGLAMRFASVGEEVIIGSRRQDRAENTAREIKEKVPSANVRGLVNEEAVKESNLIFLTLPFEALEPFLKSSADMLSGKIVVDVVNPLKMENKVFITTPPEHGSAGEMIQALAPGSKVVCAFKNESVEDLEKVDKPLDSDVVICGSWDDAKEEVTKLIKKIPNLRPIDAGGLANSRVLEGITAMLLNINRRYKTTTSIKIMGI